jgi:chromodomain-helicase-DNA-binding protein 4
VVTPNSTCPNWRREIKKWAPALRVVTYYGGKKARDMAMKYELYPDGCSDLRAHVVVTSYEGPTDDSSKSFFRRVKWAGMIVDEGQRLKNDENQLYVALKALKVPYQVLLTGMSLTLIVASTLTNWLSKALLFRTISESCSTFYNFSTHL